MAYRAMGAYNGMLPEATGMIVQFMTDPSKARYLEYTQLVAAPEIICEYWKMDPDDPTRLTDLNSFAWGYDDNAPSGEGYKLRGEMNPIRLQRWAFPYTIGNTTIRTWSKGMGIDAKSLLDVTRRGHAALHRSVRCINALINASWAANNTGTPVTLLGTAGSFFNESSGQQYLASGLPNPNFQVIKRTFQVVKRRINLGTNAQVEGDELVAVIPPVVAEAIASSGEMVEFLKGSPFAKELTNPNIVNWNLPSHYAGFKLVVEDTPRAFIKMKADGTTVADVTVSAEKDYILNTDSVYFVSRPDGLRGVAGAKSFSTLQCWHYNGEARVEAFTDQENDNVRGRIVMEDKVVTPALASGFALTDVLS